MKSMWFKIQYYLLSLWVLFFIEVVLALDVSAFDKAHNCIGIFKTNSIAIVFVLLVIIDLIIWLRLRRQIKRSSSLPISIISITEKSPDYLVFLTTIIMPLIAIEIGRAHV